MNTITRLGVGIGAIALVGVAVWFGITERPRSEQHVPTRESADSRLFYTCPMHPQVHRDHAGTCPICGMQLVAKTETSQSAEPSPGGEILYWYDPMHPQTHFDKPGKSPFMDMELVPKYASARAGAIAIDPRVVQNLGVRTAQVVRGQLERSITATGSVAIDERRLFTVESRAAGWIAKLHVNAVGESAKKGEVLAELVSPEIEAAQKELALALQLDDKKLVASARTKLELLGVAVPIEHAEGRVPLISPQAGVVTELLAREGSQLAPGAALLKLANLETVWVVVDVPQALSTALAIGADAFVTLSGVSGNFYARVDYVYPFVDIDTRTVRARLVVENTSARLKPGMWVDVSIAGMNLEDALLVPTEAVIRTGTRNVVIVAEGEGTFRPTEVTVGDEQSDRVVVLEGLTEGQRVVVSGQFLIDSEASLTGAYRRLVDDSPAAQTRLMGEQNGRAIYGSEHEDLPP
jgi:Cu(I)/Ag(I) efflux system membrane fusion protein